MKEDRLECVDARDEMNEKRDPSETMPYEERRKNARKKAQPFPPPPSTKKRRRRDSREEKTVEI